MSVSRGSGAWALGAVVAALVAFLADAAAVAAAEGPTAVETRSIGELHRTAVMHLGKTADWVSITPDAVWVGSSGPFAVNRIDPTTNEHVATVRLPGEPCAGLAASPDSVWLVIDNQGSLARVDPDTGAVRQITHLPAGSYNPFYDQGKIWVTRADGSEVTSVDASTGTVLATTPSGPRPRFLTAGGGAIWTLNQGDGSVTRIDSASARVTGTAVLRIPGKGGDISFGGGMIWATVWKVPLSLVDGVTAAPLCQWKGPGGDSLGIGHGAIWLTDYHAGTISRIELADALAHCKEASNH